MSVIRSCNLITVSADNIYNIYIHTENNIYIYIYGADVKAFIIIYRHMHHEYQV